MIESRGWFAVLTLMTLALFATAAADAQTSTVKPIPLTLRRVATVNLAQVAREGAGQPRTASAFDPFLRTTVVNRRIPRAALLKAIGSNPLPPTAPLAVPEAISVPISPSSAPQIFGFSGLDALDSGSVTGISPSSRPIRDCASAMAPSSR